MRIVNFRKVASFIAFVFIFAMEALAMAPVLDFNGITGAEAVPPWFHPHIYDPTLQGHATAGRPNVRCIYFNVVPIGAPQQQAIAQPAANRNPINGERNIYFPANGA